MFAESYEHLEDASADDGAPFTARLRALDQRAWGALYDRYHTLIWRYAYARTADRDAADDVAASVFAEALGAISRYRYTGKPLLAWLYGIARNLVGKRRREAARLVPIPPAAPADEPLDRVLDAAVLAQALRRLTVDQRDVLVLRFFSGCSTREIAAALGKSESAVYSLEVRALAALRRCLAPGKEISGLRDELRRPRGIDTVT